MIRKFDNNAQQTIYDQYISRVELPQMDRLSGTGLGAAYQRGYWYPRRRTLYVRSSLTYAAWCAGKDHKLTEDRQLLAERRRVR
jgi:hypothetical protein